MPGSQTKPDAEKPDSVSRRALLRVGSAGLLGSVLAGCSQAQRWEYTADPVALAPEAGTQGFERLQSKSVEFDRRQKIAGTTFQVVMSNYAVIYDGGDWPFGVGVAATPQAAAAGQELNPLVDASFGDLLTDDVATPFRRQVDLDVDAQVAWVRGPERGGFDATGVLLDTEVDVQTFTGVTDADEAVVVHVTRTIHRNDAVIVASGRSRPVDPGRNRPVIDADEGVFVPDEIEAGLALFRATLPLVIREAPSQLSESNDSGEKTRVVEKGDTLWDIADEEYGDPTKWSVIAEANDIEDPTAVEIGTTLVIPDETSCGEGGETTRVVEEGDTLWDIADEAYGDPTKWTAIAEENDIENPRALEVGTRLVIPTETSCDEDGDRTHVVERGDTLWDIADEEYGDPTKWKRIAEANDIENPRELEVGTRLVIPTGESDDESESDDGGNRTHVVEEGDTLWDIADEEYGDPLKWKRIAEANDIEDPRALEVGATLVIPTEEACEGEERTRVVEKGDTLWDIADQEYGDPLKWKRIAEANDIEDPRALEVGTTLVIPNEESCD